MCITKFSNFFKILQQVLSNKMDQEERIKKMKVKDNESKYDSLVPNYQLLLTNNNNLNFSFDEATNLVSHIFYVVLNRYNWFESSCTCYHYFKSYMCIHIMAVAVSNDLVKIPNHCKLMVPVGQKPKRGRIPNALKGLQKHLSKLNSL